MALEEEDIDKWNLSLLLLRILPPIISGMLLGFVTINHKPSLQSTFGDSSEANLTLQTALQFYFGWFFFVWSVVYIGGIFLLFLRPIVRGVVYGIFHIKASLPSEFVLQVTS